MIYESDLTDLEIFDVGSWLDSRHNSGKDDDPFDHDLSYELICKELEEFYSNPDNLLFDSLET